MVHWGWILFAPFFGMTSGVFAASLCCISATRSDCDGCDEFEAADEKRADTV
jgi:hypothetical protein